MLIRAIGELLPAALGIALNPFPIIAIVVLLAASPSRKSATAFACGWFLGLSALTSIALLATTSTDTAEGTTSDAVNVLQVLIGLALLWLAWRKWRGRPRRGDAVVAPKWMSRIDSLRPRQAFQLGVGLAAVNPKNFAFIVSAAASITDFADSARDTVVAGLVLVVLGSLAVLGLLAYSMVRGVDANEPLDSLKRFMLANNAVIIMVVLLFLGVKILGDGISNLAV